MSITIVSGLPRSGTSMLMRMLEAGGLPVLTDDWRVPDEHNPYGYYEYSPVNQLTKRDGDLSWFKHAQGKAVKILVATLPRIPQAYFYRVIVMQRPLPIVRASWERMGGPDNLDGKPFAAALSRAITWLSASPYPWIGLDYESVILHPLSASQLVKDFVCVDDLDVEKMAGVVEPRLNHTRRYQA